MRRISDLEGWPPEPSGFWPARGEFGIAADAVLTKVVRVDGAEVCFSGISAEKAVQFRFVAPDKETARKVRAIIESHIGKTVLSLGPAIIPED